jgi:hypothetical protein
VFEFEALETSSSIKDFRGGCSVAAADSNCWACASKAAIPSFPAQYDAFMVE